MLHTECEGYFLKNGHQHAMPENTLEKTPLDSLPADSALPPEANGVGAATGGDGNNGASADDYTADKFIMPRGAKAIASPP